MPNEDTSLSQEKPIINIIGEKVALGPYHRDIIPLMAKWLNDFSVTLLSGDPLRPITRESIESNLEHELKETQRNRVDFMIYERSTMRLIGFVELRNINYRFRTANFGILIGEKDCWGNGFGTEATILVLDYAFTILGLHNILLDTDRLQRTRNPLLYSRRFPCHWPQAPDQTMGRQSL